MTNGEGEPSATPEAPRGKWPIVLLIIALGAALALILLAVTEDAPEPGADYIPPEQRRQISPTVETPEEGAAMDGRQQMEQDRTAEGEQAPAEGE